MWEIVTFVQRVLLQLKRLLVACTMTSQCCQLFQQLKTNEEPALPTVSQQLGEPVLRCSLTVGTITTGVVLRSGTGTTQIEAHRFPLLWAAHSWRNSWAGTSLRANMTSSLCLWKVFKPLTTLMFFGRPCSSFTPKSFPVMTEVTYSHCWNWPIFVWNVFQLVCRNLAAANQFQVLRMLVYPAIKMGTR